VQQAVSRAKDPEPHVVAALRRRGGCGPSHVTHHVRYEVEKLCLPHQLRPHCAFAIRRREHLLRPGEHRAHVAVCREASDGRRRHVCVEQREVGVEEAADALHLV
jgi:hypothetical protein